MRTRTLAVSGLCMYIIFGAGAFFADNIWLVLLLRALLGVSVGMIMPLSTGLLANISWNSAFLVYLLGLPALVLVAVNLPNERLKTGSATVEDAPEYYESIRCRAGTWAASPQNGSQTPEGHSVAGKGVEVGVLGTQNGSGRVQSHSVAMLVVAPATLARNLADGAFGLA